MQFSVYERWQRRIAHYNDKSFKFVSKEILSDYEIIYGNNSKLNPIKESHARDIALQFANLSKISDNSLFIKSTIEFIRNFGMMGVHRIKKGQGFKELAYDYSENIFEWRKETRELYETLKNISALNGIYSENSQDYLSLLSCIQHSINRHLTNIYPYSKIEISPPLEDTFFLKPMMKTFNLLSSMYFAIFQDLQDNTTYYLCENCGSPFECSRSKKIKNKCPDCVVKERNYRKNNNSRSNPKNTFRNKIYEKKKYYAEKPDFINSNKSFKINSWYDLFLEELSSFESSDDSSLRAWMNVKEEELNKLIYTD